MTASVIATSAAAAQLGHHNISDLVMTTLLPSLDLVISGAHPTKRWAELDKKLMEDIDQRRRIAMVKVESQGLGTDLPDHGNSALRRRTSTL